MKRRRAKGDGKTKALHFLPVLTAVFLLMCVVFVLGRVLGTKGQGQETVRGDLSRRFEEKRILQDDGRTYEYRDKLTTILLIGVDAANEQANSRFRNGGQSDFLLLVVIDPRARTITPVHIDRDTMTEIPVLGVLGNPAGERLAQICLAHGFGDGGAQSCELTVEAVRNLLLGIDIDFYIAMNLDGISALNNLLRGVTVTLADDFTSLDLQMAAGTTLTLTGEQAETYVRSRMNVGDGTNRARMERQRVYIDAAFAKVSQNLRADAGYAGVLFDGLKAYLQTDMKRGRMINEAYESREYARAPIVTLEGAHTEGADGFAEFHPDESALRRLVIRLFYDPIE